MNDSSAACPPFLLIGSAVPLFYMPRILVFFSNPLFRVSRMSEYSRARVVSLKFFFSVHFCAFWVISICARYRVKKFSSARKIKAFRSCALSCCKTLFCSAFLDFSNICPALFLFAFSRIFRIFSRACIVFINSRYYENIPLKATICLKCH